jgi:arylsulfatase A-like enzyme
MLGAPARKTNLIVVLLESVGSRYTSREPAPMPFLRALGSTPGSVAFGAHYSSWPQTMKAHFTILCSEIDHPDYTPITYVNPAIPCVSLPEALHAAGYRTAFFTSQDLAYDRQIRFFRHRKFDVMHDMHDMPGRDGAWKNSWHLDESVTIRAALSWIDRERQAAQDRPFFLLYGMGTGHHPYAFPGFEGVAAGGANIESERAAYVKSLGYIDARLRELHGALASRGLLTDTLIAVVSDHGNGSERPGMGSTRDATIYEGTVRVPALVAGPQLAGIAGTIEGLTSHIDVAPTLLGLLGVPIPRTMKGRMLSRENDARPVVFATRPPLSQVGIRDGAFKLILLRETGARELYDVVADPAETRNLAAGHARLAEALALRARRSRAHARNLIENYAEVLQTHGRPCVDRTHAPRAATIQPMGTLP